MDHDQRNEVREMLTDIMAGSVQKIEGQYRVIQSQLASIEIQTTKTNGRVSTLEEKVENVEKDLLTHPIKCDQVHEIKKIKEDLEEYRFFKKYPKIALGIVIVAALILWLGFKQLNNKTDAIITSQEEKGVPFVRSSRGEIILLPDSSQIGFFPYDSLTYMITRVK